MKTVKSKYEERGDIMVLLEFDRELQFYSEDETIPGNYLCLGQVSEDISVLLVLDDCDEVVLEINLENIIKYERVASMAMCNPGGLEPMEHYEIVYYDDPWNGHLSASCKHHLVMFDV